MPLFRRRSGAPETPAAPARSEHAVIVHLALDGGDMGSEDERAAVFALEDRLVAAIRKRRAGEFDGNEFGAGEAVLYAYGPDADALFSAMEPALRSFPARPAFAVLRYGEAADPTAVQRRVDL